VKHSRQLEIERMREEVRVGLRTMTVEEVWDLVDELFPDGQLAEALEVGGLPAYLRRFPPPQIRGRG
jgi:hypothetical protein